MRRMGAFSMLLGMALGAGIAAGQTQGANQGSPMYGGPPQPDAIRVQQEMAQAKLAAGPLKITFGKKSSEWTAATLARLPHVTLTVLNEHSKANQTYTGVPLMELLKPLGMPEKPHGKDFKLYLVAAGGDGYEVVFSAAEATPDVHDGTVMVADTMDGKPIAEDGPLKLVATGEKRPARWVRNLVAIRVMTAE
jgi:hypothetical protein